MKLILDSDETRTLLNTLVLCNYCVYLNSVNSELYLVDVKNNKYSNIGTEDKSKIKQYLRKKALLDILV